MAERCNVSRGNSGPYLIAKLSLSGAVTKEQAWMLGGTGSRLQSHVGIVVILNYKTKS